jgi:hypothetical protein
MTDENSEEVRDLMVRRAVFGEQVHIFMNTDIGKYMIARAKEQRANAYVEFTDCDVNDTAQVQQIQNKIRVAECIEQWLGDAVGDGLRALNILEDRE